MDALKEANGLATAPDAMVEGGIGRVEIITFVVARKVVEAESSWFKDSGETVRAHFRR